MRAIPSVRSAVYANARLARDLAWGGCLPEGAVHDYPDLGLGPDAGGWEEQKRFALAVAEFQFDIADVDLGHKSIDGKLDWPTMRALWSSYAPIPHGESWFVEMGIPRRADSWSVKDRLVAPNHLAGFDMRPYGAWRMSKGARAVDWIVVHGGFGHDARSTFNERVSSFRSSHFGVDEHYVYQWLDLGGVAYHAATFNENAVGVDICQAMSVGAQDSERFYLEDARLRGLDVEPILDPTARSGHAPVLSVDLTIARSTRELVQDLCRHFDIPYQWPRGRGGLKGEGETWYGPVSRARLVEHGFRGILGNFHTAQTHADPAPWWEEIFGP